MILVTGATGHIGNVLVKKLVSQGEKVRVLVRKDPPQEIFEDLDIEYLKGDILDSGSLDKACQGVEQVYHLAGVISIGDNDKLAERVNVTGTKNVIEAVKKNKVKRLIYTSSIHAFCDRCSGVCLTEKSEINSNKLKYSYDKTKALATELICQEVQAGKLDAVIVYPTGAIGPFDYKPSKLGQFIIDFVQGKMNIRPQGEYDFVDVRDVVDGLIAAANVGKCGEGYFLSGEKMTITELMKIISQYSASKVPKVMSPIWLSKFVSHLAKVYYFFSKKDPVLTPYAVATLAEKFTISLEKSKKELNYNPRPLQESIKDSINWFIKNNKL